MNEALTGVLGENAITTFYYAIRERFNLPEIEFERRPMEVLQHLEEILGPEAYQLVEGAMMVQVRETFGIDGKVTDFGHVIELAKIKYLQA